MRSMQEENGKWLFLFSESSCNFLCPVSLLQPIVKPQSSLLLEALMCQYRCHFIDISDLTLWLILINSNHL